MTHARTKSTSSTADDMRLGDLPLGSLESRAAARALLNRKLEDDGKVLDLIIRHIGNTTSRPMIGRWNTTSDGRIRISHLPGEMTMVEAERMVAHA